MGRIIPAPGGGEAAATASVNATADQPGIASVTLGLTIPGGETPSAYAWQVNGGTTGLSDATAATPTFTWTQPGNYTKTCTLTINGAPVIAEPDTFLVGDGLPRVRTSLGATRISFS
jgi:hypothetical protein